MSKQTIKLKSLTVLPEEMFRVGTLNLWSHPYRLTERLSKLSEELVALNFDIIAIQEINHAHKEEIVEAFTSLGFTEYFVNEPTTLPDGTQYGTAIFSKPFGVTYTPVAQFVEGSPALPVNAIHAAIPYNNTVIHLFNAHLSWGSANEWVRVRQAELIDTYVKELETHYPEDSFILVGDLNATQETSTLRYLKGLQESPASHRGTLWVDAWDLHGHEGNFITSDPDSVSGATTAAIVGLPKADLIIKRRIDYILSYGWCYGKQGYPLNFHRFTDTQQDPEISDHFGLWSDIYIPVK